MKSTNYIRIGMLLILLIMSRFTLIAQEHTLLFSETYASEEVLALLDPSDAFFQWIDASQPHPFSSRLGTFTKSEAKELVDYIQSSAFRTKLPDDLRFAWGVQEGDLGRGLYALKDPGSEYKGPEQADIKEVSARKTDSGTDFGLFITFSEQGAAKWATLTRNNKGRNIAILVEGTVYAAPRVMEEIKNGECLISGDYTEDDVNRLIAVLE
jgi:hypothetical protein